MLILYYYQDTKSFGLMTLLAQIYTATPTITFETSIENGKLFYEYLLIPNMHQTIHLQKHLKGAVLQKYVCICIYGVSFLFFVLNDSLQL